MSVTVNFTDQSTPGPSGPLTAWAWDFGDGGTSTSQNPSHSYTSTGTYTVSLTVTGTSPDGTANTSHSVTVTSAPPLAAAFSSSASALAVTFTDASTAGPSGPITGWAWNFGDGGTSTLQNPSHTYAAAGSYTVTLTVTGTSPDGTASISHAVTVSSGASASFPSVLSTSGRSLVDANGHDLVRMKGFNIQPAGWSLSHYNDMHALGARVLRTMVFWDEIEPSSGSINSSYVTGSLDTHIANCNSAGLYTQLCLYFGPNNVHCPGWVGGSQMSNYVTHGQNVTQYLANRYGKSSSPQYNKAVIGFGLNEITPDSTSGSGWLTTLINQQATMVSWFRAGAPDWIAFISAGYGAFAPKPNVAAAGQSGQSFTEAPLHPFTNFVMDLHVYAEATTSTSTRPVWDGRSSNGSTPHPPIVNVDAAGGYPHSGTTRTQCQQFLGAFMAPHAAYCTDANVPLSIGEWGWVNGVSGGTEYGQDLAAAAANAGAAIEMYWDYNTNTGNDKWAARPGGSWQSAVTAWMSSP